MHLECKGIQCGRDGVQEFYRLLRLSQRLYDIPVFFTDDHYLRPLLHYTYSLKQVFTETGSFRTVFKLRPNSFAEFGLGAGDATPSAIIVSFDLSLGNIRDTCAASSDKICEHRKSEFQQFENENQSPISADISLSRSCSSPRRCDLKP